MTLYGYCFCLELYLMGHIVGQFSCYNYEQKKVIRISLPWAKILPSPNPDLIGLKLNLLSSCTKG